MKSKTESWQHATAKGALVWGSVYSTATAGSAYALSDSTASFPELITSALMIFPFFGAFRGALMWRVRHGYNAFRGGHKKGA